MSVIGSLSIVSFALCSVLTIISFVAQYYVPESIHGEYFRNIAKYRFAFSSANLLSMSLASLMMLLSYHIPTIFGTCLCHELFVLSIAFYVVGNYAMKLCFLLHCHLVFMILHSGTKQRYESVGEIPRFEFKNWVALSLAMGAVMIVLIGTFSDGECLADADKGCKTTFDPFNGFIAIGLTAIDGGLLTGFAFASYRKLQSFGTSKAILTRQFLWYWLLEATVLTFSMLDIAINTAFPDYDTLAVLLADCTLIAFACFLGFSPAGHLLRRPYFRKCRRAVESLYSPNATKEPAKAPIEKALDEGPKKTIQIVMEMTPVNAAALSADTDLKTKSADLAELRRDIDEIDTNKASAVAKKTYSVGDYPAMWPIDPVPSPPTISSKDTTSGSTSEPMRPPVFGVPGPGQAADDITSICSSALSKSAVAARCPKCRALFIIHDDEDKWEVLKLHIKAFHVQSIERDDEESQEVPV